VGGTFALACGTAVLTLIGYTHRLVDASSLQLFDYQMEKLDDGTAVEIAFIGDSSLGHTIDADLFGELAGRRTVNLALTARYGYGGSYNMLRHLLARHDPQFVVILHNVAMLTEPRSPAGYHLTSPGFDLEETSPIDLLKVYLRFDAVRGLMECVRDRCWRDPEALPIVDDYPPQGEATNRKPTTDEVRRDPLLPEDIEPDKSRFLGLIAELCDERGIACLYAHGPIFDPYCEVSSAYIDDANAVVRVAGLPVVKGTPACVPWSHLGDARDHVRPELKQRYTSLYYRLLMPYLGGSGGKRIGARRDAMETQAAARCSGPLGRRHNPPDRSWERRSRVESCPQAC